MAETNKKKVDKLLASLPDKVKIGPYIWTLLVTDRMAQTENEIETGKSKPWGQCEPNKLTIKLLPDPPTTQFAVSILLHELWHAAMFSSGCTHPKKEEQMALMVETVWTGLFADNLWMLDWIKRGLK